MLRKIHLYGNLAQRYGERFDLQVSSIGETILALDANFPGFKNDVKNGKFYVFKGSIDEPFDMGENKAHLIMNYNDNDDFHLMPAIEGAGGDNPWLTIVIGVILIAATYGAATPGVITAEGIIASGGMVYQMGMAIGISLVLSGIAQLLTPTPQVTTTDDGEKEKPSFLFNGPVNRTEQGGPVTLVYGEITTGSVVVGGSIDTEDYA